MEEWWETGSHLEPRGEESLEEEEAALRGAEEEEEGELGFDAAEEEEEAEGEIEEDEVVDVDHDSVQSISSVEEVD